MVLELYASMGSPPCRLVYAVLKHLNIPYEQKTLNMREKEHLQPQFLELNPFHTIPTIVDDGFSLFESRAIITYLVEKYAPNNHLYPSDIHKRASINRWLYWETATLSSAVRNYMSPVFRGESEKPDAKAGETIVNHVGTLDSILSKRNYIAGDNLTLADIALAFTVLSIKAHDLNVNQLANVNNWLKRLESDLSSIWTEIFVEPIEAMKKRFAERAAKS